ncbi:methylmalonyl-CoA mutase family protein [Sodaliphilus sp.]|uniref:methylmalonyl-CoA mutase family protein n=1 Tax=Sodaliphilus sp. TaxID=2815818 RepID=UPI003890EB30
MAETRQKLFDMFPPVSPEEWRAKAEVDLKGADFGKKMVWRTNEGFDVQPLYRGVDIENLKATESLPGEYPFVRGTRTNNDWLSRQDIVVEDVAEANAKALDVLNKGIDSLGFKVNGDVKLADLLKGIYLPACEINIMCCPKCALGYATELVELVKAAGCEETFKGSIDFDPFKRQFKHGVAFPSDVKAMATELLNAVKDVKGLKVLSVNTKNLTNAGAYIYQELGYALSWGNEWMAMMTEAGFSADEVAHRIKFNMGVSTIYFMEIAKFRAARQLWAQIVKEYKPECECACKMVVNAETSKFNQTLFDSHVNLLRSQTEAMSAALGCVDSIVVVPFDAPYQKSDDFSERIARNQQILLREESHLDKVVDPAGGSYYIEMLTASLAQEGWKLFLDVEDKGGFNAAVNEVVAAVNASAKDRFGKVAKRREQLLGTNQFPNFTEVAGDKAAAKCECKCECACEEGEVKLNDKRLGEEFEEIRLATEKAAKQPVVFMLTIGNLAMRLARAQFSDNFFACAGYKLIDNNGFKTVEEGVNAAMEQNADIVVLCSSDDEYPTLIPEAVKLLDGKAELVLAGPETDEFKEMGVTNFINVRTNVLSSLKAFNAKLLK